MKYLVSRNYIPLYNKGYTSWGVPDALVKQSVAWPAHCAAARRPGRCREHPLCVAAVRPSATKAKAKPLLIGHQSGINRASM